MACDEIVPSSRSSARPRVTAVPLEHVLDRGTANIRQTQFDQFSFDSCVSPAGLLCDAEDQPGDVRSRPWTTILGAGLGDVIRRGSGGLSA